MAEPNLDKPVTYGRIFRFWSPLAGTWLMMAVASLQMIQSVLGASFYWELAPGILVSPGSAVLFASVLDAPRASAPASPASAPVPQVAAKRGV